MHDPTEFLRASFLREDEFRRFGGPTEPKAPLHKDPRPPNAGSRLLGACEKLARMGRRSRNTGVRVARARPRDQGLQGLGLRTQRGAKAVGKHLVATVEEGLETTQAQLLSTTETRSERFAGGKHDGLSTAPARLIEGTLGDDEQVCHVVLLELRAKAGLGHEFGNSPLGPTPRWAPVKGKDRMLEMGCEHLRHSSSLETAGEYAQA
jgi:hypothetical protein